MAGSEKAWPGFHKETAYEDGDTGSPVALTVLTSFGLPIGSLASSGGSLSHLDIKRMDALQAIKLSLLEASMDDGTSFYELSVNADGDVIIISVGKETASLLDVYYEVQSSSFSYECSGVMVTGGKGITTMKDLEWKPIWGDSPPGIYDITAMITGCVSPNYSSHAVIVFKNPHMASGSSGYKDGITNLYELSTPFQSIIGYAKVIDSSSESGEIGKNINVNYSQTSASIPINITTSSVSMGTLQSIHLGSGSSACWPGGVTVSNPEDGILIKIPDKFRFTDIRGTEVDLYAGVEQVIIIGWKIDYFNTTVDPSSPTDKLTDSNSICVLTVNSPDLECFRLEEGKHYVIGYQDGDPYAVFSKRTFPKDPKKYSDGVSIKYKPLTSGAENGDLPQGTGCVFPLEGNNGILVQEVWAYVKVNCPSITVTDTGGLGDAKEVAESIRFNVAATISENPPAPVGFNGESIDLAVGVADKDPTTQEDFTDTPMEAALDTMAAGGHGISINLSFLETDLEVATVSGRLHDIMSMSNGVNATTLCGPDADPILGTIGSSGGVVNSINYTYSDSASYTISVSEGDMLVDGLGGGCTLAPSFKTTEELSARGVILDSNGDGVTFKVRVDGFGEIYAINTVATVLRVGDVVTCSIHNVPVEV